MLIVATIIVPICFSFESPLFARCVYAVKPQLVGETAGICCVSSLVGETAVSLGIAVRSADQMPEILETEVSDAIYKG